MDSKAKKLYLILFIALVAGYTWLIFSLVNHRYEGSGVCLIKSVTGIPCPSCGSTRSVMSIINGDIASAVFYNPFGFLILILMVVLPVMLIFDLVLKKAVFYNIYLKLEVLLRRKTIAIPLIILVLINWIWNILKNT